MNNDYEHLSDDEIKIIASWRNYLVHAQIKLLDYIVTLNDNPNNLQDRSMFHRIFDPELVKAWREKRIDNIPKPDCRCSFCNKRADEVKKLISGMAGIYICNECVEICNEILEEKN